MVGKIGSCASFPMDKKGVGIIRLPILPYIHFTLLVLFR